MAKRKITHTKLTGRMLLFAVCIGIAAAGWLMVRHVRDQAFCANAITCILDLSGEFQPGQTSSYMGKIVDVSPQLAHVTGGTSVLGDSSEEKHIYVDLSTQRLTAYDGKTIAMSFPVSTGRWHPTPTGDFRIWVKLRYAHMSGGNKSDRTYYNLYNVPYTMYFYSAEVPKSMGFGLHGAYWHNNFGHPMSHGCVNIRPEDAQKLFEWAGPVSTGSMTYAAADNPGTLLTITGETPDE